MFKGMIGKKLGMTGIYSKNGDYIPVTVIETGPCVVTQIKNLKRDKYQAAQLGFGFKKDKNTNKALKGHFKKSGEKNFAFLREFQITEKEGIKIGQSVSADLFEVGEKVDVSGTSKGRGFTGVIKRHGFHGGPATHGSRSHRIPGAIGACAWPAKVVKGKKMPGQYGNTRVSVSNLEIVDLRLEDNLIFVKGAVPGPKNGLLEIRKKKV